MKCRFKWHPAMAFFIILFIPFLGWIQLTEAQMISYGMRKLALSMNQFGLDLLRASERSNQSGIFDTIRTASSNQPNYHSYSFCPFCIGTTLATLLAGLWSGPSLSGGKQSPYSSPSSDYNSLRDALYLTSMQPQEIHLAFFDLMRHLQVNMPDGFKSKRSLSDYGHFDHSVVSDHTPPEPSQPTSASSNLIHLLNAVYVQRYLPVDYNYHVLMQHYYRTPVRSLDFAFAPEESRQHINAMLERSSQGKIQNLLPADEADDQQHFDLPSSSPNHYDQRKNPWSHTRLLLLSAIYFRGKLDLRDMSKRRTAKLGQHKVSPHLNTVKRPSPSKQQQSNSGFSLPLKSTSSTAPTTVPTTTSTTTSGPRNEFDPFKPLSSNHSVRTKESIRLRHSHSSYLNATVVEMPFVDGIISLLALVPDNSGPGMNQLVSRLNAQLVLDLVQSLDIHRVDITIPSLSIDYSVPNLEQLFSQLGLSGVLLSGNRHHHFRSSQTNFAGIEGFPLSHVTQIHHKTVLDIEILDNNDHFETFSSSATQSKSKRNVANNNNDDDLVSSPIIQVLDPEPTSSPKSNRGFLSVNRHRYPFQAHHHLHHQHTQQQQPPQQGPIAASSSNSFHSKLRPQPSASLTISSSVHPPQRPPQPTTSPRPYPHPISKPSIVPSPAAQQSTTKRTHINLDQQDFVYLILDNISGLIIAIGKYRAPVN